MCSRGTESSHFTTRNLNLHDSDLKDKNQGKIGKREYDVAVQLRNSCNFGRSHDSYVFLPVIFVYETRNGP